MKKHQTKYSITDNDLEQILNLINYLREAIFEKITQPSSEDYCGLSELEYWEEISKINSDNELSDLKDIF